MWFCLWIRVICEHTFQILPRISLYIIYTYILVVCISIWLYDATCISTCSTEDTEDSNPRPDALPETQKALGQGRRSSTRNSVDSQDPYICITSIHLWYILIFILTLDAVNKFGRIPCVSCHHWSKHPNIVLNFDSPNFDWLFGPVVLVLWVSEGGDAEGALRRLLGDAAGKGLDMCEWMLLVSSFQLYLFPAFPVGFKAAFILNFRIVIWQQSPNTGTWSHNVAIQTSSWFSPC